MRDHGTSACYAWGPEPGCVRGRGCRCMPCVDARKAYDQRRREQVEPAYVSATLVRAELLEERIDQTWRTQAACRNRPPWMWFPARGDHETMAAAKKVCAACFVRVECLAANLDKKEGVYGGLSARERRTIRSEAVA